MRFWEEVQEVPWGGEVAERRLGNGQRALPKKLKPFLFLARFSGKPQALRAIFRIAIKMGEPCSARGVAVFRVRRADAKSSGILHWAGLVSALVMSSSPKGIA